MPFPEKFRELIELREHQVTIPDLVWLSYAVCAVEQDSCGWRGWIIESAWKTAGKVSHAVEADTEQCCPMCGKHLYRTQVEKQFQLNPAAGPKIEYPYRVAPVTFTKPNAKPVSSMRKKRTPKTPHLP